MVEGPYAIIGAIAAIVGAVLVFVFGVYEFVWQPRRRRYRLRLPCSAWFHIPAQNQRQISFAEQNHDSHHVEELTLATNSVVEIEFLFHPLVSFEVSEVYFGCDSPKGSQPIVQSYRNLFIDRGVPEESPETHPDTNYTDNHNLYHIRKSRVLAHNEVYSYGCKIETRELPSDSAAAASFSPRLLCDARLGHRGSPRPCFVMCSFEDEYGNHAAVPAPSRLSCNATAMA
jgi:hypothetical protein